MTDVEKQEQQIMNDAVHKDKIEEVDAADQQNAVGYKEYREALNLEVSDQEVSQRRCPLPED